MIPERVEDIKKCQFLKKNDEGEIQYCYYYSQMNDTPCSETIQKECVKKFTKTSCC